MTLPGRRSVWRQKTNIDGPSSSESSSSFTSDVTNKTNDKILTRSLTVLNANARSLTPKIESLADCMYEIEASIAIVTETWLQDGEAENFMIDAAGEYGLV